MDSKLVSIIIPTYNYAHFIQDALDCVLAQSYRNWECIIVDDGSTDNTRDVVGRYLSRDDRFRYIYQKNQGASAAKNNGIRNSNGVYLQFLDADDLIESGKVGRQVEFLEQHPQIDFVYGSGRYFYVLDENEHSSMVQEEELNWMPIIRGDARSALLALIRRPFVIHAPLIRRSVFESVGNFNENLRSCEDWYLWIRCAVQGKLFRYENLNGTLALYRRHPESLCADRELFFKGIQRLRKEVRKIIEDPEALLLNQTLASEDEGYRGILYVKEGRLLSGIWQCLKAGIKAPGGREKVKWWYCATVAPFSPRDQFEQIVASPVGQSLKFIIRHHLRIAS